MKSLLFIITFSIASTLVMGQCCSAGNPLTGIGDYSSLKAKTIKLSTAYKSSVSSGYYHGAEIECGPIHNKIDHAYFDFLEMSLLYSATNRLSMQADLGYFLNKAEIYENQATSDAIGKGLGDLGLQLRYTIYRNVFRKLEVNGGAGIKIPIGVFDQEAGNIRLQLPVQPSSGSYKYFANLFLGKAFSEKFSVYGFGMFEWAQWINMENFEYKYGNVYQMAFGANYKLIKNLSAGINVLGEIKARSHREENQIVNATGGQFVSVTPALSYSLKDIMMIESRCRIPVYKYYNGLQIGNRFMFEIRLSKKFRI
ncbi:MAG: hypothetical protein JEZ03_16660 [Bacteroidales bacterium]|nr:hypothetical protein [Bacteroidales bacterium]